MFRITILTTGGTIEKTYDEADGSLANRETIVKNKLLSKLRLPHHQVTIKGIMAKDSLHMDDQDREIIMRAVELHQKSSDAIVILHGTDTMEVTAKFLFEKINPAVAVIMTGAMKPLGFEDSDARQNFTEALMACELVERGVYISFHGKLFAAPNVKKDREKGTFVISN